MNFKNILTKIKQVLGFTTEPEQAESPPPSIDQREAIKHSLELQEIKKSHTPVEEEPTPEHKAISEDTPITKKVDRNVVVGIDMGTDSTKVVYQVIGLEYSELYNFSKGFPGYPSYAIPTTATLSSGKLYFGYRHGDLPEETAFFTSFKMCLACHSGANACKNCSKLGMNHFQNGVYENGGIELDVQQVSTLFLAYIVKNVTEYIHKKYNSYFNLNFQYNFSFPVNYLEENEKYFTSIIFNAYLIYPLIDNGIQIDDGLKLIDDITDVQIDRLNKKEILYCIHETTAAMQSFLSTHRFKPDLYTIVDVGAGTTDVSVFRLSKNEGEFTIRYYADQSHSIGGDDIDLQVGQSIKEILKKEFSLNEIKQAKNGLSGSDRLTIGETEILLSDVQYEMSRVLNRFHSCLSDTICNQAFRYEPVVPRWLNLNIVVIGGGANFPGVRERLKWSPFKAETSWSPNMMTIELPPNIDMRQNDVNEHILSTEFHYYSVAHGLSYVVDDILSSVLPKDIGEFKPLKIYRVKFEIDLT